MKMKDIEIYSYDGVGYHSAMHYGAWRVAIANYGAGFDRDQFRYLERHLKTDEAFVLLAGNAMLVTGMERSETPLAEGRIYNVRCGAWHALLLEPESKVLIVENHDTARENSEYFYFR